TGTLGDNIVYGNVSYHSSSPEQIAMLLEERGLMPLLDRFEQGLATPVAQKGDTLSIGQKQIIAFIRAVLRDPSLLILDEATANIDTVTENTLQEIIKALPAATTKVVIAHRLHTIANADEIFFVNNATITPAGSFDHAVEMIMGSARVS
ncbi:MAG: ATP-binding cassette domain-containing protein, partial [bacterium]